MPAIFASISYGCDTAGNGFVSFDTFTAEPYHSYSYVITGALEQTGALATADLPLRVPLANGDYTAFVRNEITGEYSVAQVFTLACTPPSGGGGGPTCDVLITNVGWSLVGGNELRITVQATSSALLLPALLEIVALGSVGVPANVPTTLGSNPGLFGQPYVLTLTDTDGCTVLRNGTTPVFGCTDPDADNCNPAATRDDLSCAYVPRLGGAPTDGTMACGAPLPIIINSIFRPGVLDNTVPPRPAEGYISLELLAGELLTLTVNGYVLRTGALTQPGRFVDAPTLLEALLAIPVLAATYLMRLSQDYEVHLKARAEGTAGNLTIVTSAPGVVSVSTIEGRNRYRSQDKPDWSCWLEVYVRPTARNFGGDVSAAPAELAGPRLELPYHADNTYSFDIARLLRPYTDYSLPDSGRMNDRLIAYYLRYGERYADEPGGLRRDRATYVTPALWGALARRVEGAVVGGVTLLTERPSPWRVRPLGNKFPLQVLAAYSAVDSVAVAVAARNWQGALAEASVVVQPAGAQGRAGGPGEAGTLALWASLRDDLYTSAGERLTTGTLALESGGESYEVATLDFTAFDDTSPVLHVLNRLGGIDLVLFEGSREDDFKRTASTFASGAGTQPLSAEASTPARLYTAPLTRAVWDWLRVELAVSPRVWLELTPGGEPVPVRLTDVDAPGDHRTGDYSVAVVYESQPVEGLSN